MTDAQAALTARLAGLPTEQLKEISLRMTLADSNEAIIVCTYAERELERRVPEAEFLAHMAEVDALLDLAIAA